MSRLESEESKPVKQKAKVSFDEPEPSQVQLLDIIDRLADDGSKSKHLQGHISRAILEN